RAGRRLATMDVPGADPAARDATAGLLRPRRGGHDPEPGAARPPARARPAVLRTAGAGPLRRQASAHVDPRDGRPLPLGGPHGAAARAVPPRGLLLRLIGRAPYGSKPAPGRRGGGRARLLQRRHAGMRMASSAAPLG